jgi:uncharacterized protein (DUF1684 family)
MTDMEQASQRMPTWLELYDWRKRVAALYAERDATLRLGDAPEAIWLRWRAERDRLFALHPQSPLSDATRHTFTALPYYPYDQALRITAQLEPLSDDANTFDGVAPAGMRFRRAARLRLTLDDAPTELILYWIDVYGGGLFLPFWDASAADATYDGGRYLCDTVKGSDLFHPSDDTASVIVDFNYAYNPSCAYDDRWFCPLAPRENRLAQSIRAGEQRFHP